MRPLFQVASWFDLRRLFSSKPVRRGRAHSMTHGVPVAGVVSEGLEDRKLLSATLGGVASSEVVDPEIDPDTGGETDPVEDPTVDPIDEEILPTPPTVTHPVEPLSLTIGQSQTTNLETVFSDASSYSLSDDAPEFVSINDDNELEIAPDAGSQGKYSFNVIAMNDDGDQVETTITVKVVNQRITTSVQVPDQKLRAGDAPTSVTIPLNVTDADGDEIEASMSSASFKNGDGGDGSLTIELEPVVNPETDEVEGYTLKISGKATAAQVGEHVINLKFEDGHGGDLSLSFKLSVTDPGLQFNAISNRILGINQETTQIKPQLTEAAKTAATLNEKSVSLGIDAGKVTDQALIVARKLNQVHDQQAANLRETIDLVTKRLPAARAQVTIAADAVTEANSKQKTADSNLTAAQKKSKADDSAADKAHKLWKDTPAKNAVLKAQRWEAYQVLKRAADKSAAEVTQRKTELTTASQNVTTAKQNQVNAEKSFKAIEARIDQNKKDANDFAKQEAALVKEARTLAEKLGTLKGQLESLDVKITANLATTRALNGQLTKLRAEMVEMNSTLQSLETNSLLNGSVVKRVREITLKAASDNVVPLLDQAPKALTNVVAAQTVNSRTRDGITMAQKALSDAQQPPVLLR